MEPVKLTHHHRATAERILSHPTSHNIEWHAILSLLNAVGTVRETGKGHIEITIGNAVEVLEQTRRKEVDAEQLAVLRRLLRNAGYGPEGSSN